MKALLFFEDGCGGLESLDADVEGSFREFCEALKSSAPSGLIVFGEERAYPHNRLVRIYKLED